MKSISKQVGFDIADKLLDREENGSPYDRGGADSYYRRDFDPHWYPLGTYIGDRVELHDMTQYEIDSYTAGFKDNEDAGFFKY